jgi:dTDP-4-amino-4,6-dideoxygalactose transaminase
MPSRCTAKMRTALFRWRTAAFRSASGSAEEVISLPMHAYLEAPVQDRIIDAVRRALAD